jgi:hypothetical protein
MAVEEALAADHRLVLAKSSQEAARHSHWTPM